VVVHTARCAWIVGSVLQVETYRTEMQVCVVRAGCYCRYLVTAVQKPDLGLVINRTPIKCLPAKS